MAIGSLAQAGVIRWSWLTRVRHGTLKSVLAFVGGLLAFFVASYTGVLLSVTNRPVWADSNFIGLLFLVSAASTSAALLLLLARWRQRVAPASISWLRQMDSWALFFELVVLVLFLMSLGVVVQVFLSVWGVLLLAVVLVGIIVPLLLHWKPTLLGTMSSPLAAALVLVGGFILRAAIILSSESIEGATAWLTR
jgi:formate-dependent nitrite reductase membrane component NrfD